MTITQTALVAISVTSATYGALSLTYAGALAARAVLATRRKVGGLTFFRVGRWQVSICKPRAASVITAARIAAATKRAQSHEARRLDAIASRWCNG